MHYILERLYLYLKLVNRKVVSKTFKMFQTNPPATSLSFGQIHATSPLGAATLQKLDSITSYSVITEYNLITKPIFNGR